MDSTFNYDVIIAHIVNQTHLTHSLTDELKLQFSFCSKRIFMTIMTNIKIHFNINIAFDPLEIVSLFRQFSIIHFQHAMIDSLEMIFLEWIFNTSRSFFLWLITLFEISKKSLFFTFWYHFGRVEKLLNFDKFSNYAGLNWIIFNGLMTIF